MKDSADIRKINLNKIRSLLWTGKWFTKQKIAAETGLSVATCNTLLNELANSKEVLSEKIRTHDVGPSTQQYQINENFESILCVWFDRNDNHDLLTINILAMTGTVKQRIIKRFEELTSEILFKEIKNIFETFKNISSVMIGTPSIAENGIIRHCDIIGLENYEIVSVLSEQFKVPVCLENDMHFKVYGYAQNEQGKENIATLANFPLGILPGTATVHGKTIIKGRNQFAGMVGFLPFDMTKEEFTANLQPDLCRKIVSKTITALIAIHNPNVIILTGSLLDENSPKWILSDCMQWIPKEYLPTLIFRKDMSEYYLEGMYRKALELKGEFYHDRI